MKFELIFFLVALCVLMIAFELSCSEDDGEAAGYSSGDDDSNGGGTNDCGEYGDVGCTDSSDKSCESAGLANTARYENPEESDCAPSLKWSEELAAVAYAHSKDMCDRGFFDHANPDGEQPSDRMDEVGVDWVAVGENIAMGTSLSAKDAHDGFMNEPECEQNHRSNILSRFFTHIGVGVYECGGNAYLTQNFATFSFSDLPDGDHGYCGPGNL